MKIGTTLLVLTPDFYLYNIQVAEKTEPVAIYKQSDQIIIPVLLTCKYCYIVQKGTMHQTANN